MVQHQDESIALPIAPACLCLSPCLLPGRGLRGIFTTRTVSPRLGTVQCKTRQSDILYLTSRRATFRYPVARGQDSKMCSPFNCKEIQRGEEDGTAGDMFRLVFALRYSRPFSILCRVLFFYSAHADTRIVKEYENGSTVRLQLSLLVGVMARGHFCVLPFSPPTIGCMSCNRGCGIVWQLLFHFAFLCHGERYAVLKMVV